MALGIVAFWAIVGLRTAFVSPGNQRGNWVFRSTHGRPTHFDAAIEELVAAKTWVLLASLAVTIAAYGLMRVISPAELLSWNSAASQMMAGAGICVILTDAFFGSVMVVPFTGEASADKPNMAFTLLKFFTFFPVVTTGAMVAGLWMETSWVHFGVGVIVVLVIHLWFRYRHREVVRVNSLQAELEEGEDDFPMRLGLKY